MNRPTITIKGKVNAECSVPELGAAVRITWTDGVTFEGTLAIDSPRAAMARITRAARRLERRRSQIAAAAKAVDTLQDHPLN